MTAVLAFTTFAAADEPPALSADDAVEAALAHPAFEILLEARLREQRASLDEATMLPNPTLSLDYEQVLTAGRDYEFSAIIHREISWTPWRARLRSAGAYREAAIEAELETRKLELDRSVRLAFYTVRYHEARQTVFLKWNESLVGGVRSIQAREQAGDASLYERLRIERELERARALRAVEELELARAWAELLRWLPHKEAFPLEGALRPSATTLHETDPSSSASIARIASEQRAVEEEARALGASWLRHWEVGAGYRLMGDHRLPSSSVESGSGHGLLLSLAFPLPFRDVDRPRIDALQAESLRLEAELAFETSLLARAQSAAAEHYQRTVEALEAFEAAKDSETHPTLTTLSEAAFAAGEAPLVELLDAYESDLNLQLLLLDLEWAARRAFIELEYLHGVRP